ncbi:unnamed protein product, partial [Thlaspi arvense]
MAMASSSKITAAEAILLRKRRPEDDLKTKPILKKHTEKPDEIKRRVKLSETKFDQVDLISVKECIHRCVGFVEFASANEAKKALQKKNGINLLDRQISLVNKGAAPSNIKFFEDFANVVGVRLIVNHEGKHVGYGFVEFDSAYQANINFFKDVGQVVHVRLRVDHNLKHVGNGFVEFASANEANKALNKKNGEYLHDCQIFLDVVKTDPDPPRPIYKFFNDVGDIVRVRLIVTREGRRLGCCFVEFASADEAKKAVQTKNCRMFYVNMAEIAPYPFRAKYKLAEKLAEKLLARRQASTRRLWFGEHTKAENTAGMLQR